MTNELTRNGTDGRVYGGDRDLVHIADKTRGNFGAELATTIDRAMRYRARWQGKSYEGTLCPGCYMIALFNAAVTLAQRNGQPLTELGNTMANAFARLADNPNGGLTEEIEVILDPC